MKLINRTMRRPFGDNAANESKTRRQIRNATAQVSASQTHTDPTPKSMTQAQERLLLATPKITASCVRVLVGELCMEQAAEESMTEAPIRNGF